MKINKIGLLDVSPPVRMRSLGWWVALGVFGCGPTAPRLPAVDAPRTVAPGDARLGQAALRDRALGRTGLACADCHSVDAPRPGPALGAATADGIDWCVERYLHRPALDGAQTGHLLAAAATLAPADALPSDGAALFAQQCAGCHAGGPAAPLEGRPWADDALRARIRGADRPRHPDGLMPPFPPAFLDDAALDRIVEHLANAARREQAPARVRTQ